MMSLRKERIETKPNLFTNTGTSAQVHALAVQATPNHTLVTDAEH